MPRARGRSWEGARGTSFSPLPELSAKEAAAHPEVPPPGNWALGLRPLLPVGHVVEVLGELRQVGALLLVLLFCPKQNLRNLKKEADWIGLEPSGFPGTGSFSRSGTRSPPPARRTPYLYLIEELRVQQRQLLGYFMAVEIMQGPRPGRQSTEMSGVWTGRGGWAVLHCGLRTKRPGGARPRFVAAQRPRSGLAAGRDRAWLLPGLPCRPPSPASAAGSCGPRLGPWTAQLPENPLPGPISGAWWGWRWCHVNEAYNTH